MIVEFTESDLSEMHRLAQVQFDVARSKGTPRMNNFRPDDHVRAIAEGFMGEWAVADALGVSRSADLSGVADDGSDVSAGDLGINVRFTTYLNGRLMCPANKPFHDCEWVVLVVGTGFDHRVRIVGGLTVDEFYQRAKRQDFGYGPTDWVPQSGLRLWADIAPLLLAGIGQ